MLRGVTAMALFVAGVLGPISNALAMPHELYLQMLKMAQRHVDETKNSGAALSGAVIREFVGRYYEPGDTWEVAAVRVDSAMSRMTDDPAQLLDREAIPAVFRYEVVSVRGGIEPEVLLKVTQVDGRGVPVLDPSVQRLEITFSDRLVQTKKKYFFKNSPEQPVEVSSDGLRTRVTPLELYPLDAPDLTVPRRQAAPRQFPSVPARLQKLLDSVGFHADIASRATWLEEDDFFGRPVQALWAQGDPWPVYLKTANGVAVLISKGRGR